MIWNDSMNSAVVNSNQIFKKYFLTIFPDMTHPELHKLFITGMYAMHWFENAWIKTLGQLSRSNNSTNLAATLKGELSCSQEHVNRVRKILESLGEPLESVQSKATSGMIEDLAAACLQVETNNTASDISLILTIIKFGNY